MRVLLGGIAAGMVVGRSWCDAELTFSMECDRYDQAVFSGRVKHFAASMHPRYFAAPEASVKAARDLLEEYRTKGQGKHSDAELWEARQMVEATVHPQTGEPVFPTFRVSACIPIWTPMAAGMLLSPATPFFRILWQFFNNSYDAGFAYHNRNTTNDQETVEIMQNFAMGVVLGSSIALGGDALIERSPRLRASGIASRLVPFVAVAGAASANCLIVRRNELFEGITVMDSDDKEVGKSTVAGRMAVSETAVSRWVMAGANLFWPPVIMAFLARHMLTGKRRGAAVATEVAVIALCNVVVLPCAFGLFPQKGTVLATSLESKYHSLGDRELLYNKGL